MRTFFRQFSVLIIQFPLLLIIITSLEFGLFISSPSARMELNQYIPKYFPELINPQNPNANISLQKDLPFIVYWNYYFQWLKNIILNRDWGYSEFSGRKLNYLLGFPLITTLKLAIGGLLLSTFFAFLLAAGQWFWGEKKIIQYLIRSIRFISSIHYIIMAYFFYYGLRMKNPPLILAILIIALGNGVLTDTMDLFAEDFKNIFTSRYYLGIKARGGNLIVNLWKPFTIRIANILNAKFPMFLSGTFIVEYIINIRALGLETIQAVLQDDHLKLLVITFLVTVFILISNTLNSIIQSRLDPRPMAEL